MIFDIDTAVRIGEVLRGQERVVGVVNYSVIDSLDDVRTKRQLLLGHLRMMEDAGWVTDVGTYNIAGDFQARLTYGGQLWLDVVQDESLLQRVRDVVTEFGLVAANSVVVEVIKSIASRVGQ